MENAGVWLRVSSGGQDEANQEPDIERHCRERGYRIARRYRVHGKSASKGRHQPDLDRMLADIRDGHITVVVIWHSDRIERRPGKALLDLLAEVAVAGGRVESVQEPQLGQLDFGSQVTTFIAGLVNHEKSAHLSDQVRAGHAQVDANSAFRGRIPFGYTTMGPKYAKHLVPTEQGRELIPVAYQMIIDGASLREVAEWLTERTGPGQCKTCEGAGKVDGKKCRDCIVWWAKIVAELIRRPVYRGHHANSNGVTVHKCERLVDAAVWKRANDSLDARPKRGKVYAENRAMLAGVLTCPKCNGPMLRTRDGRGGPYYYRCAGTGPQRKTECRNMVRLDLVDGAVNQIIAATFNIRVMVRTLIAGHDHSVELAELAYELQQLPMQGLDWEKEDAERARLRAEYNRVNELESVPDRWIDVPNGHTYAGLWEDLRAPERGQWLKDHGFTVQATRETVTVAQGEVSASVSL